MECVRENRGLHDQGSWGSLLPQNNQHSNSCSKPATLSDGLDAFATYTQRAAGGIAVASLIPQAFGGPIDPVADVFTGAGEALAGVLEVSSLSASAVSGGIQLFQGNPLPAATTAMGAGLGAASGLTGPAAHIANTINGEVGSALTKGPC